MLGKRHTPERIIQRHQETEVEQSKRQRTTDAVRELRIAAEICYRWREDNRGPGNLWLAVVTIVGLASLGCATPRPVASEPVNGCDPASSADYSREREVEIRFGGEHGYEYVPRCITVSGDTRIRFRGNFATHPLVAGRYAAGVYESEPESPVQRTETGEEATFVFSGRGAFGFLCDTHVVIGMMGAIFVERES